MASAGFSEVLFSIDKNKKQVRMLTKYCLQGSILRAMFNDDSFSDVTLYGKPATSMAATLQPIRAYKAVLGHASAHLYDLFTVDGFVDSHRSEYKLENVDHESLRSIVKFIHTDELVMDAAAAGEHVRGILIGAKYLIMNRLAESCEAFLASEGQLTLQNCVELWCFARKYSCLELMHACSTFMAKRLCDMPNDAEFLRMSYADCAKLLMCEAFIAADAEERYRCARAWLKTDINNRIEYVRDVLNMVPFTSGLLSIDHVLEANACDILKKYAPDLVHEAMTNTLKQVKRRSLGSDGEVVPAIAPQLRTPIGKEFVPATNTSVSTVKDSANLFAASGSRVARMVFMITAFPHDEKSNAVHVIKDICNAKVIEVNTLDTRATHMLSRTVSRTEKMLCCIGHGVMLLHPSYVAACQKVGHLIVDLSLLERSYEWGADVHVQQLQQVDASLVTLALAQTAVQWRKIIRQTGEKPMHRVLCALEIDPNRMKSFERVICAAGGTLVDLFGGKKDGQKPLQLNKDLSIVFVDKKTVAAPEMVRRYDQILRAGVHILDIVFVADFLSTAYVASAGNQLISNRLFPIIQEKLAVIGREVRMKPIWRNLPDGKRVNLSVSRQALSTSPQPLNGYIGNGIFAGSSIAPLKRASSGKSSTASKRASTENTGSKR